MYYLITLCFTEIVITTQLLGKTTFLKELIEQRVRFISQEIFSRLHRTFILFLKNFYVAFETDQDLETVQAPGLSYSCYHVTGGICICFHGRVD